MINMVWLKRKCKEALESDVYYLSRVQTLLGEPLNYYHGTNENRAEEILPAMVFLVETSTDPEGENAEYPIIFNIQIEGNQELENKGYNTEEIVAELAVEAVGVLKEKISCFGDFYMSNSSMAVAPITDAMIDEDETTFEAQIGYQVSVEVVVSEVKFLNKG